VPAARAPRLAAIAAEINRRFPELDARMEEWTWTVDKAARGSRFRIDGKRYRGKRLAVYARVPDWFRPIFTHFPPQSYPATNADVLRWVEDYARSGHAITAKLWSPGR